MKMQNRKNKIFLLLMWAVIIVSIPVYFSCDMHKEKTYVVGIVNPNPGAKKVTAGFIRNLEKHGYIAGENITFIKSENKKNMGVAIKDMVTESVDLIFTVTTPAARKTREIGAGINIPHVFVMHDPVASGLVKNLTNPGSNFTGIQLNGSTPKALEFLLAVAPGIKHIFVPITFDTKAAYQSLVDLKENCEKLGVMITSSEVGTVEELQTSLSTIPKEIDAIFIPHSILIGSNFGIIVDAAIKNKILLVSSGHEHYKQGAVISYGPKNDHVGEQAGRLAHSMLQRISPVDLPVEMSDFFLGINLKTAQSIGLEISNDILQQADFIIR